MSRSGSDVALGMRRRITRREFVAGAAVAAGALAAGCDSDHPGANRGPVGTPALDSPGPDRYPPKRHGLRGSHDGSFEVAHQLALEGRTDWGTVDVDPSEYDLVVVGGGISGLTAAFLFLERRPDARVLILENHDDFGGHAKRNEFRVGDRTIVGYGGSQSLENPGDYSDVARGVLERLGVEPRRFDAAYDFDFYRRHGLTAGVYFDAATYGVDRFVKTDLLDPSAFVPTARAGLSNDASIARMPLGDAARNELLRILSDNEDRVPDASIWEEPEYLRTLSYLDFLKRHLGVEEPEVVALFQDLTAGYFGHGIDAVPALDAMLMGLPGTRSTSLGAVESLLRRAIRWLIEPYIYHFPDGNASIARLLVRRLVPDAAPGSTMDDIVTSVFDYDKLDVEGARVRLRLSSSVIGVEHDGDAAHAERVGITYVRAGRATRVFARQCVLACYNMAIPYLCPGLPQPQKQALASLVKSPLVYSNVLLRSWKPCAEIGFGLAHCPGSWHKLVMVDFPVSLGDYHFTGNPDEPIVLHLQHVPTQPGLSPADQSRAGRAQLLTTSFETIERHTRVQLAGLLGPGGFDPAEDILALVVNRWPHGYAYEYNPLFDPEYPPGEAPHEVGRRRFGRIAIANSDAGARAYLDCAIDEAARAVDELTG